MYNVPIIINTTHQVINPTEHDLNVNWIRPLPITHILICITINILPVTCYHYNDCKAMKLEDEAVI